MPKAVPASWLDRKTQLQSLLGCKGRDDDDEGIALDRFFHQGNLLLKSRTSPEVGYTYL